MACLEMYNNNSDQKGAPPRISFSNDFAESHSQIDNTVNVCSRSNAPVSTDFEFSVSGNSFQLSADELFSRGRILPMKDTPTLHKSSSKPSTITTLRDELLAGDDEDDGDGDVFSSKPPQSKAKWKGFLSLSKSHFASKKTDLPPDRSFSDPTSFFAFPQGLVKEDGDDGKSGCDQIKMKM